jgi:hypothetical protein
VGRRDPKAYTFTKNAEPQFNLLPDGEPVEHFSLFFNDELLNNNIIETNSETQNCGTSAKPEAHLE